ncbi:MAG: ATP-binding protein [Vicinamibacterales bacterium]|nr:ATP-binding protein [Vicinamibacterales bacterium]
MTCPLCDDTGWQTIERDGVSRVARCSCWRNGAAVRHMDDARIPRRYQHCDFGNFRDYNESLRRASVRAQKLADEFPVVDRGLFLEGPPGVGKTHLAVAVLRQTVATRGARGLFYDTRDLLRVIRSTYDPVVRTTELDILRPVMTADILVLDDLGAEKTSEWVEETLNLIVNTRYNERRVTVFTSNYEDRPDETDPNTLLCRIGFRMRSRLHEMCDFLDLDGADYREAPANAGQDDLLAMWKLQRQRGGRRVPGVRPAPVKAQLKDTKLDLLWPGGRAGS